MLVILAAPQAWSQDHDQILGLRRQASELYRANKAAEALPLSQRALALAEQQFGENDPRLAEVVGDLGGLYAALARHAEAEAQFRRELEIYDKIKTGDERAWLALIYLVEAQRAQGLDKEAEPFAARARAIEAKASAPFVVDPAVPFEFEIITTDLKRLRLVDCGAVSFEVKDPQRLLSNFRSLESARRSYELTIRAVYRSVLGTRSSSEIRDRADLIVDELKQQIDARVEDTGVLVSQIGADFRTCAVPP